MSNQIETCAKPLQMKTYEWLLIIVKKSHITYIYCLLHVLF